VIELPFKGSQQGLLIGERTGSPLACWEYVITSRVCGCCLPGSPATAPRIAGNKGSRRGPNALDLPLAQRTCDSGIGTKPTYPEICMQCPRSSATVRSRRRRSDAGVLGSGCRE
jgi:hypothetical protein